MIPTSAIWRKFTIFSVVIITGFFAVYWVNSSPFLVSYTSDGIFSSNANPSNSMAIVSDLRGNDPLRFKNCPAFDTEVERVACRVGATAYAAAIAMKNPPFQDFHELFTALATIEAANLVRFNVSPGMYSYIRDVLRAEVPNSSEFCLIEFAGICGNQIQAYIDILKKLGIRSRAVQFYYSLDGKRESHIGAEVYYMNQWNYIDVTWGFMIPRKEPFAFKDAASIIRDGLSDIEINKIDAWAKVVNWNNYDVTSYFNANDLSLVVDGVGNVTVSIPDDDEYLESFTHIPNYVGDNKPDGRREKFELQFDATGERRVTLHIDAQAGCDSSKGDRLVLGDQQQPIQKGEVTFRMAESAILTTLSSSDVCYVVFSKATFSK